jgi:hypothetical protein
MTAALLRPARVRIGFAAESEKWGQVIAAANIRRTD